MLLVGKRLRKADKRRKRMRHQLRRLVNVELYAYEAMIVDSICSAYDVIPYEIGIRNVRYSRTPSR
jgi:hypothetical protein